MQGHVVSRSQITRVTGHVTGKVSCYTCYWARDWKVRVSVVHQFADRQDENRPPQSPQSAPSPGAGAGSAGKFV